MRWVRIGEATQWHYAMFSLDRTETASTVCGKYGELVPDSTGPTDGVKGICRRCRKFALGQ